MLSCNEISLNYAIVLYDKSHSKIEIVQDIIQELPRPPHTAYFLCDSWYASNKLMDAFAQKGFQTIGALRTNHIISPRRYAFAFCQNKKLYGWKRSTGLELSGMSNLIVLEQEKSMSGC